MGHIVSQASFASFRKSQHALRFSIRLGVTTPHQGERLSQGVCLAEPFFFRFALVRLHRCILDPGPRAQDPLREMQERLNSLELSHGVMEHEAGDTVSNSYCQAVVKLEADPHKSVSFPTVVLLWSVVCQSLILFSIRSLKKYSRRTKALGRLGKCELRN